MRSDTSQIVRPADGEVLFDNGRTLVLFRRAVDRAGKLTVSFNHLGSVNRHDPGFGESFLLGLGHDVLLVKPADNDWYQDLSLDDLRAIRAALPDYDEVLTYGLSMGGYAAAYFAEALGACRAVLVSPQFSMDPRFVSWETRWQVQHLISFAHGPMECRSGETQFIVFHDPFDADGRHYREIARALGKERVIPVITPFCGHPSFRLLGDVGLLKGMLTAALDDPKELPRYIAELRRAKKTSTVYLTNLAQRGRDRSRAFAEPVLERAIAHADTPARHTRLAEFYLQNGMVDRAAAIAAEHELTDPVASADLGEALRRIGRREEAISCLRRAADLTGANFHYLVSLATTLAELTRVDEAIVTLEEALRTAPHVAETWRYLAAMLRERARFTDAVEAERRADHLEGKGEATVPESQPVPLEAAPAAMLDRGDDAHLVAATRASSTGWMMRGRRAVLRPLRRLARTLQGMLGAKRDAAGAA